MTKPLILAVLGLLFALLISACDTGLELVNGVKISTDRSAYRMNEGGNLTSENLLGEDVFLGSCFRSNVNFTIEKKLSDRWETVWSPPCSKLPFVASITFPSGETRIDTFAFGRSFEEPSRGAGTYRFRLDLFVSSPTSGPGDWQFYSNNFEYVN